MIKSIIIKTELCHFCQNLGYCEFEKKAIEIASSVIFLDDPEFYRKKSYDTWIEIWNESIVARKKFCPHVSNIDPKYPGKELLD